MQSRRHLTAASVRDQCIIASIALLLAELLVGIRSINSTGIEYYGVTE